MYKLPDSPEKRALIEYLIMMMEECNKQQYIHEGTSNENFHLGREYAYDDILDKIR